MPVYIPPKEEWGQKSGDTINSLCPRRCTILLVTHDYRILDMADRVVTLEDGVIQVNDKDAG